MSGKGTLPPDRSEVATEQRHPDAPSLDGVDSRALVEFLVRDQGRAVAAVAEVADELAALVETVAQQLQAGGRLIYLGAGTSGRLGVLDASECPPTFNSDPAQVLGVIAGGDQALRRSSEGAEDDPAGIEEEFTRLEVSANDVVVGIAAGGTTPWVLGALKRGDARGAHTVLLCCAERGRPEGCRQLIVIPTGPEPLTGSTRMVAGTATKIALNTLTTGVFTRLGKVRGNRMIDLRATNDKLHDRCLRILCELFPALDREEAQRWLAEADGYLRDAVASYEEAQKKRGSVV